MTIKKEPRVVLTERDLKLFRLLFEYKTATVEKIQAHCFKSAGLKTTRMRLKKLEQLGCIEATWDDLGNRARKIFSLTEAGKDCIGPYYQGHKSNFQLKSECWEHDLVLLDIGKRLAAKETTARYLPENLLQSNKKFRSDRILGDFVRLRSDGFLELNAQDRLHRVAVEFENSTKRRSRYERLVNAYYLAEGVEVVFYFHKSDKVKEIMAQIEEQLWPRQHPKFYFCKVEKGHDWSKKIALTNRKGLTIRV